MITYNTHPSLLFLSYDKDNAPTELPFEVAAVEVRDFLTHSHGYQEMFGIIGSLNSLGQKPKNYWLNNLKFKEVEYNYSFRNSNFRSFLDSPPRDIQYGCICFKDGGQYVYLYMPPEKSKIKEVDGAYFCGALFRENLFIGFEEAILENGFSVLPTGFYQGMMDVGGYLSFISICLAFFNDGSAPLPAFLNNTNEEIWTKN